MTTAGNEVQRSGERTSVVLGTALALAVLLGLVVTLVRHRTRSLEPRVLYEEWFEPRELPLGLEPVQAEILPRGDRVLRLELPAAEPEVPRIEPATDVPEDEFFDWSKVPIGAHDTPPREVVIVEPPLAEAALELEQLFKGGSDLAGDWRSIPRSGAVRILDRGEMRWAEFQTRYVIERQFEHGGTFRDVLRVNLSREDQPRFLIARWSRGFPASKAPVERLLAALVPRP